MDNNIEISDFDRCPNWVKEKIELLNPSKNLNAWVNKKIPALKNKSILETMETSNGELELRKYFSRAIGK